MTDQLTVAVTAFESRKYRSMGDLRTHLESELAQAKAGGSQVVVLPELLCMGLLWTDAGAELIDNRQVGAFYRRVLTPLLPEYLSLLRLLASAYQMTLVGASYWHEEAGKGRNSAFVVRPDGEVLRQDKLHMTRGERAIATEGGSSVLSFDVEGTKCALYICYDVQFPEVARHLVDHAGIEVLFVPSLTEARGSWRIWHSAHARAIENQLYVCVSPLVGPLDIPCDYKASLEGRAFISCPIDNRLQVLDGTYACNEAGQSMVIATLDLLKLRASRSKSEIRQLADRRLDLYRCMSFMN